MTPDGPRANIAALVQHRNEVLLVGRVAQTPLEVTLPSGDVVVTLRLVVERAADRDPGRPRAKVDTVDCAAWSLGLQQVVRGWAAGDTVEVGGALRRRFWRGAQGAGSRYEIEVSSARLLADADEPAQD